MDRSNHRIVVGRRGGPDVLQMVEEDLPTPDTGEIRVRVEAAGVSGFDVMLRSRSFPGFPKVPYTPGVDVVGEVDALGEGVDGVDVGDVVASLLEPSQGGYAEYVCFPASHAVPVPDGLDPGIAVCVVANYLTAHGALHRVGGVRPGERVLIQGAAGGVGTALLDLGRLAGVEMYGTASIGNHRVVEEMGGTPIDYRSEDVPARIRELTNGGVDAVFDPIGGARQLRKSYRCLGRGGRLVWFGVASSREKGVRVIPASLLMFGLLKATPGKRVLTTPGLTKDLDWYRETLGELLGLLAVGDLRPVVADRIRLAEAARAHEWLESGGVPGKIVLVPTV